MTEVTPQARDEFADLDELMSGGGGDESAWVASRRRGRRIGLIVAGAIVLSLLATAGGYVAWALNAPLPAPTMALVSPDVPVAPATVPVVPSAGASAISVSGADDYMGETASGIWAATGADDPRVIASITKLITALVILDRYPLADASDPGPTITFTEADHDLYDEYYVRGATIAAMPAGSTMSLRDALSMMLVPSASNYADAVAGWAFGSRWAFLEATRTWLDAHGLEGTTIVEPTGLDSGNLSTPSDLIAIGKIAREIPAIVSIASRSSMTLPIGTLSNTNALVGSDGVTGLKTGNLGMGTYSVLYTATLQVGLSEPLRVTGILLDGHTRDTVDADVRTVLNGIRNGFRSFDLVSTGQEVGTVTTAWGESARIVVASRAWILTWSDTPIEMTMHAADPETFEDGAVVGRLDWTAGPESASVDLVVRGTIEPPSDSWRLSNPAVLWGG